MRMKYCLRYAFICCLMAGSVELMAVGPTYSDAEQHTVQALLQELQEYPHTKQIKHIEREVIDHEVGLGAIQKVRGEWHFKDSERLTGTLISYTWLMENGFSSAEVMEDFLQSVAKIQGSRELFACEGRACGRAVQWANRVFNQRVLFGREGLQKYRVFALEDGQDARLLTYSAERSTDRQYLHIELLLIAQ